jgi:hypothetical protein
MPTELPEFGHELALPYLEFPFTVYEKSMFNRNAHLVHQNWYRVSFTFNGYL